MLKYLILIFVLSSIFYYFLLLCAFRKFFGKTVKTKNDIYPPVSILKPVKGLGNNLYDNFESFCTQNYPEYEIVFGVASPDDPSVETIQQIKNDFPNRSIKIIINGEVIGKNSKVNNLHNMCKAAKNDIIVISDSDVRVSEEYLKKIVVPLNEQNVGMVTCPYRAVSPKNIFSKLEALIINTDLIPQAIIANYIEGISFALGATYATRKSILESVGGFESFADYIADDYQVGNRIFVAGYKLQLCDYIIEIVLCKEKFMNFLRRQIRWNKTIKSCRPWGYFSIIFTFGLFFSFLFLILSGFSRIAFFILFFIISLRLIISLFVNLKYLKANRVYDYIFLLPIKDILIFFIWLSGFFGNIVFWGDKSIKIDNQGKIL